MCIQLYISVYSICFVKFHLKHEPMIHREYTGCGEEKTRKVTI